MCGRYTETQRKKEALEPVEVEFDLEFTPCFNVAPTQEAAIIVHQESRAVLRNARWGLVPNWSGAKPVMMINARSETASSRPAFRYLFQKKRCLVLADGFYEWQTVPGGKQPIYFHMKSRMPFAFAGLWNDEPDAEAPCFCILTVQPNDLVARVHNRMPLILRREALAKWIDPQTGPGELACLLQPYSADEMESFVVSKLVNSPGHESPACVERVELPSTLIQPSLF